MKTYFVLYLLGAFFLALGMLGSYVIASNDDWASVNTFVVGILVFIAIVLMHISSDMRKKEQRRVSLDDNVRDSLR